MRFSPAMVGLASLLIALSGRLEAQEKADVILKPSIDAPAGKVLEWTTPQGQPYWYFLPAKIDEDDPPALLLMLHGTGVPQGWAFWNYGIAAGKFRSHDIIVAPEGMTRGQGDSFNFVQGKKDGEQLAGLIELFREEFPLGPVYVYGHSQGAFFSYWFAGEYPDHVDGIVAHAGNVLDVKHSKQSRQGVAVGILHGKADAVVTVECAYRSHDIYKQEGYQNLRLYIVKGLTERSGHWPLPVQVNEMLDWLDLVSPKTAQGAMRLAFSQIQKNDPDLWAVATATEEARTLVKKLKGVARASIDADLALLDAFLGLVRDAHVDKLADVPDDFDKSLEYQSWMPHFASVNRVFGEDPKWKSAMGKLCTSAAKHQKQARKALDGLDKRLDKKSYASAIKAFEKSVLCDQYLELTERMERLSGSPPKGTDREDRQSLSKILADRSNALEAGVSDFRSVNRETAATFVLENATRLGVTED